MVGFFVHEFLSSFCHPRSWLTTSLWQLQAAYETLSDPTKRRLYDVTRPKTVPFSSSSPTGATRGQTATQEGERSAQEQMLETLLARKTQQDATVYEVQSKVWKLRTEIDKLQTENTREERAAAAAQQTGWWGHLSSFMFGAGSPLEPPDVKEERERRCLQRGAAIRIKSTDMTKKMVEMSTLKAAAQGTATAIECLREQIQTDQRQREAERMAREQRQRWDEYFRRQREAEAEAAAEAEKERQRRNDILRREREAAAKAAAEAEKERQRRNDVLRREREAAAEAERKWMKEEQEARERVERVRKQMERERAARWYNEQPQGTAAGSKKGYVPPHMREQQQQQKQQQKRASTPADGSTAACLHKGWWTKILGPAVCSVCIQSQSKFTLQCPRCQMKACFACKRAVQNGRR